MIKTVVKCLLVKKQQREKVLFRVFLQSCSIVAYIDKNISDNFFISVTLMIFKKFIQGDMYYLFIYYSVI